MPRPYIHWKCLACGASGHSNDREAEAFLVNRHREKGHHVQTWIRGHKNKATILPPFRGTAPKTMESPDGR